MNRRSFFGRLTGCVLGALGLGAAETAAAAPAPLTEDDVDRFRREWMAGHVGPPLPGWMVVSKHITVDCAGRRRIEVAATYEQVRQTL